MDEPPAQELSEKLDR